MTVGWRGSSSPPRPSPAQVARYSSCLLDTRQAMFHAVVLGGSCVEAEQVLVGSRVAINASTSACRSGDHRGGAALDLRLEAVGLPVVA